MNEKSQSQPIEVTRSWQVVVFEVTAIVFSVLFALFMSEWWQDREEAQNHAHVLELLIAELRANKEDVQEGLDYYKEMAEALRPVLAEEEVDVAALEAIDSCCSIQFGGNTRTVHEMAMLTGLYTSLDPEVSTALAAPYIGYESIELLHEINLAKMIETAGVGEPVANAMSYYVFIQLVSPTLTEIVGLMDTAIEAGEAELAR